MSTKGTGHRRWRPEGSGSQKGPDANPWSPFHQINQYLKLCIDLNNVMLMENRVKIEPRTEDTKVANADTKFCETMTACDETVKHLSEQQAPETLKTKQLEPKIQRVTELEEGLFSSTDADDHDATTSDAQQDQKFDPTALNWVIKAEPLKNLKSFKCPGGQKVEVKVESHEYSAALPSTKNGFPGSKNFSCSFGNCDYTGPSKGSLEQHIRRWHNSKCGKLRCNLCFKLYTDKNHLYRHIRTVHTKEDKLRCESCSFVTSEKSTLKRHVVARHLKKKVTSKADCVRMKNFKCSFCDYHARYTSIVEAHERRKHSGEKPFACKWNTCAFRTSYEDVLQRHERIHDKNRPLFQCPKCFKMFVEKRNVGKHVAIVHSYDELMSKSDA